MLNIAPNCYGLALCFFGQRTYSTLSQDENVTGHGIGFHYFDD